VCIFSRTQTINNKACKHNNNLNKHSMVSIIASRISRHYSRNLCSKLRGRISMRDSWRQQISHKQLHWLIIILINHRLLGLLLLLSHSQLVRHTSSSTASWRIIIKKVRIGILLWIIATLRGRYEHIVILLNLWKLRSSSRMDIGEDKGFLRIWSFNQGFLRIM